MASSSMDGLDMGIVVAYIAADAFHQATGSTGCVTAFAGSMTV